MAKTAMNQLEDQVELIRREAVNQIQHPLRAGEITVMQKQPRARLIRILINVVDALRIECARPTNDPVNFVPFGKQQFRQVRAVLPGNSGDECSFHG